VGHHGLISLIKQISQIYDDHITSTIHENKGLIRGYTMAHWIRPADSAMLISSNTHVHKLVGEPIRFSSTNVSTSVRSFSAAMDGLSAMISSFSSMRKRVTGIRFKYWVMPDWKNTGTCW